MLTPREQDILCLMAKGLTDKEIARKLFITHNTVGDHRKRMYRTLNVKNAPHAVAVAYRLGLLELQ